MRGKGVLFQEQVLRIVNQFAGLSYAEADAFRRAMTKDRKSGTMELLKQRFIQGARQNGYSKVLAEGDSLAQVLAKIDELHVPRGRVVTRYIDRNQRRMIL